MSDRGKIISKDEIDNNVLFENKFGLSATSVSNVSKFVGPIILQKIPLSEFLFFL